MFFRTMLSNHSNKLRLKGDIRRMEKIKKNMKIGICLSLVSCVIAFFCIITEMKSFYDVYVALFEFEQSGDSYITTSLIMLFIVMCVCLLAILIATGYLCFSFNKINSVEISSDNRKQLKRKNKLKRKLKEELDKLNSLQNRVIYLES